MAAPVDPLYRYCAGLLTGVAADPRVDADSLAACAESEGVAGLLLDVATWAAPVLMSQREALQAVARRDAMRDMAASAEARRVLAGPEPDDFS